jgi:hypothetical protein
VVEAALALDPDTDPAAIGAAITVELCGHWKHEGSCRWPHHSEVVESGHGRARIRTVVTAGSDAIEVERRIGLALTAGRGPGIDGTWSVLRMQRAQLRPDEVELAARIGPQSATPPSSSD